MASSELGGSLRAASRDFWNKFLEQVAAQICCAALSSKKGKVPWGFSAEILWREPREQEPMVTKNMVSFAHEKYCKRKLLEDIQPTSFNYPILCKGRHVTCNRGRPKGITLLKKHHQITITVEKNEIATLYFEEKNRCKEKVDIVSNGWLKQTIERVCNLSGLPNSVKFLLGTIRNFWQPIFLTDHWYCSLMTPVVPHHVTLICAIAQLRRCLRASEWIGLANDLIKWRPLWKRK